MRYHGGKYRLAPWVISHFPEHRFYTEAFGGAAGVLLQKPRSYAEVYNDLDGDMTNFFRVLRDPASRQALIEQCVLTPYSRDEFEQAWDPSTEPVERARRLCVRAQMGFGSAGATKGTTGFRIDCFREYGTAQHLWARFPDNLRAVGERLTGVLIENRTAIEVLRAHDAPETLHYIDPPYLFETRVLEHGKNGYYRHEMTDADHLELLKAVVSLRGMVVISGYPNEMYDQALDGWHRVSTVARISAGRGTSIRTEVLWISPAAKAGGKDDLLSGLEAA
ncbi:DNA adenine methylase [Azoarcus sp. L1K30]|uniref:DNA adenine methylase n=1 Tax=Azoarcus sp. L1K30 TaxID=2820277 RepID=UPI001B83ADF6|nr:DNA adenine methylase [Azoarcus sp. L1K30]